MKNCRNIITDRRNFRPAPPAVGASEGISRDSRRGGEQVGVSGGDARAPPPPRGDRPAAAPGADKAPPRNVPAPDAAHLSADFRGQIGKYQIKDLIGEGGMGLVFKAEDIYLRRTVALKVMKSHVSNDNV